MSAARATQVPGAEAAPESDCLDGARHPRFAPGVIGQTAAEQALLSALASGRLHHAWLITGPQGVGKASFAWRAARYLLTQSLDDGGGMFGDPAPPESLDSDTSHPVAARALALSEPRLMLLRRTWDEKANPKRFKAQLTVDEVRRLRNFFALSVPDGGRRVVIVDSADDMNPSAANALLKQLEEPPANTVFLLISHRPSRLLPTIRSRCRMLRCAPLAPDDLAQALAAQDVTLPEGATAQALTVLAGGSVGRALQLLEGDGLALYARITRLMERMPDFDRPEAIALAEWAGHRSHPERFELTVDLLETFLARLARTGAAGPAAPEAAPNEARVMARLCPGLPSAQGWARAQDVLGARLRTGKAANLDPAALMLDTILDIAATANGRPPA
jgi:DNA polymerase-3 subunit delta'